MVTNQLVRVGLVLVVPVVAGLAGCGSQSEITVVPPAHASPAAPTTSASGTASDLPPMKHFRIGDQYGPIHDCLVDGTSVSCTLSWADQSSLESYTGTVVGTLSGTTLTGTSTTQQRFHDEADPSCTFEMDTSGPVTYVFSPDGTVLMRGESTNVESTRSGSCSGTESGTTGPWESSAKWSVVE